MRNPKILRWLDQHLGPLVLRGLGLFKRSHADFELKDVHSIGLLKIAAIGDTVLASAILSDLKNWRPDVRITLFVGPSNFEYAQLLSGVDQVVLLDFARPFDGLKKLWQQRFDIFFDLDSWPRVSAMISAVVRRRLSVGFLCPGQNRHYAYERTVEHLSTVHEWVNYRRLLEAIKIPTGQPPQPLGKWQPMSSKKSVVFHLWPGGKKSHLKEWPLQNWRNLTESLLERGPINLLLTGANADKSRNEEFVMLLPKAIRERVTNIAGSSLHEVLRHLEHSCLLVSVNTGIMHLGAALGVPTVGLHGPTNPNRWGPVGPRVASVVSHDEGAGHLHLGFEYFDDINRMQGLKVEDVVAACLQFGVM